MDGLTKIITKINQDNKAECERIVAEAKTKAAEIIESAKLDGKAQSDKIIADAKAKALLIDAKAKSGADLEYKRSILYTKCKIINDTIEKSIDSLSSLDDTEYFANIEKLILAFALDGEGLISFSEKDVKRTPDGFIDSVNAKLEKGKSVKISDKHINTKGGFVLVYPEMRVDCTFESLIQDVSDDIKDILSRILFA